MSAQGPVSKLLLIDGDSILHTASQANLTEVWWGGENTGTHVGNDRMTWMNVRTALDEVVTRVANLKALADADDVGVIIGPDDKSKNFRRALWPDYKAHRRAADVPVGLGALRDRLRDPKEMIPFRVLTTPDGIEADDMLGQMMTFYDNRYNPEVPPLQILWSPDKDMRQIPGAHLVELEFEGHPVGVIQNINPADADRWHLYQTLTGDQSDGYPGLPGVGPVKATKLLGDAGPRGGWDAVVHAFIKAGLTQHDALIQARVARILRSGEEPGGWTP